jgi:phage terminase large subunit
MEIEIPYEPRPLQEKIHNELKRFNVLVCHRRFGKTVLAVNHLIMTCCEKPNSRLAYIAPTYRQGKAVAYDYLKEYTEPLMKLGGKRHETELKVDLWNGSRIQIFGADNPDSLRGLGFDGVVLDEFALMSPRTWSEIVRPAIADKLGYVIFIGTPMGHNHFWEVYDLAKRRGGDWYAELYRASESDVIAEDELEEARLTMPEDQYEQEFEVSFQAAVSGAYYGKQIQKAEREERITDVDYYVNEIEAKGYNYGRHIAPHDITTRELGTGKSRLEVARDLGIDFEVCPKLEIDHGIEAVRNNLDNCWFDKNRCKYGIDCLRQYRKQFDDRMQTFKNKPLHDWASHGADAFRYGCSVDGPTRTDWARPMYVDTRYIV